MRSRVGRRRPRTREFARSRKGVRAGAAWLIVLAVDLSEDGGESDWGWGEGEGEGEGESEGEDLAT